MIDFLQHMLTSNFNKGFGSTYFFTGINGVSELIIVLAIIDLPFEKPKIDSGVIQNALNLQSSSNFYLFSKEVIERKSEFLEIDVICSQKIFDPEDPIVYDDEDPEVYYDKPVDEYMTNKIYASRIVITNSTPVRVKVNRIFEIPKGSIPTDSLDTLKIQDLILEQFGSSVIEIRFYFPKAGTFSMFPATVVSNGKIISIAKNLGKLEFKTDKKNKELKTISEVLENGNIDDIIGFIKSKNILNRKIFRFDQVYWLLTNKTFYENLVQICGQKEHYDNTVWSFSLHHGDYPRIRQFLRASNQDHYFKTFVYHKSDLLQVDRFSIREHYPLINPRAHALNSAGTSIINDVFKKTYNEYLGYLFMKFIPNSDDLVLFIGYLIAQDQIEKAFE